MYFTYVLFSKTLDKYYVGSTTHDPESRLRRHNSKHRGYTGKTNDWKIVFKHGFPGFSSARKLEMKIKKRGAMRYLDKTFNG